MLTVGQSIVLIRRPLLSLGERRHSTLFFKAPTVQAVSVVPLLSLPPPYISPSDNPPLFSRVQTSPLVKNNNFLNSFHLSPSLDTSPTSLGFSLNSLLISTFTCSTASGFSNHTDSTNPLNLFTSISNINQVAAIIPQQQATEERSSRVDVWIIGLSQILLLLQI